MASRRGDDDDRMSRRSSRRDDDNDRPSRRPQRGRDDDDEDDDDYDDAPRSRGGNRRGGFKCPYCGSSYPPRTVSKISGAGWIVFTLFILFFFPLCWVGLLMKDNYRECADCGAKLGA